ncbi:uncharacterized protein LOC134250968 [Saccostrea cucullata]|uniref:uncharacterized protein LOC134250968 n=1 Tax=Saccostrea cuccullata TaxID=36930 RepID=UPI002ED10F9B
MFHRESVISLVITVSVVIATFRQQTLFLSESKNITGCDVYYDHISTVQLCFRHCSKNHGVLSSSMWHSATKRCGCCKCEPIGNNYFASTPWKILTPELCFKGYSYFSHNGTGSCFRFVSEPKNYSTALLDCVKDGGHLVRISSPGKNQLFIKYLDIQCNSPSSVWIEGKLLPNNCTWVFEDKTVITYENWKYNKHCTYPEETRKRAEAKDGYKWFDNNGTKMMSYLCEAEVAD